MPTYTYDQAYLRAQLDVANALTAIGGHAQLLLLTEELSCTAERRIVLIDQLVARITQALDEIYRTDQAA